MSFSPEVHRLTEDLAVAQIYDAAVKADLFATALSISGQTFLIDPFAMDAETLAALAGHRTVQGVIVTNENHVRNSAQIAARLSVPIYANAHAGVENSRSAISISAQLEAIPIAGAPPGEVALYCPLDGGTLIVGDALINFGSHSFALLPAKYCADAKLMRKSLRRLLDYRFARMLFAHGTPVVAHARAKLLSLLDAVEG